MPTLKSWLCGAALGAILASSLLALVVLANPPQPTSCSDRNPQ